MDVINAIAANQGFSVEYSPTSWSNMFKEVENGTADMAASSISITPERKEKYTFSDPYVSSRQLILTTNEYADKTGIKQFASLPVASKPGTTSQKISTEAQHEVVEVKEVFGGIQELRQGKVAGVIGDTGMILHYKNQPENAQFVIIDDAELPKEDFGIMVKKGDVELLRQVNAGLANIKSDGTYQKIHEKWFGVAP